MDELVTSQGAFRQEAASHKSVNGYAYARYRRSGAERPLHLRAWNALVNREAEARMGAHDAMKSKMSLCSDRRRGDGSKFVLGYSSVAVNGLIMEDPLF